MCVFMTELCVDYYCVPIAVYHHEPSRRKLALRVGNKNKMDNKIYNYNHTELQYVP